MAGTLCAWGRRGAIIPMVPGLGELAALTIGRISRIDFDNLTMTGEEREERSWE